MSTPDVVVTNLKIIATGNDPYQIEFWEDGLASKGGKREREDGDNNCGDRVSSYKYCS